MFQTYLFVLHIDKRASNYCSLICCHTGIINTWMKQSLTPLVSDSFVAAESSAML